MVKFTLAQFGIRLLILSFLRASSGEKGLLFKHCLLACENDALAAWVWELGLCMSQLEM